MGQSASCYKSFGDQSCIQFPQKGLTWSTTNQFQLQQNVWLWVAKSSENKMSALLLHQEEEHLLAIFPTDMNGNSFFSLQVASASIYHNNAPSLWGGAVHVPCTIGSHLQTLRTCLCLAPSCSPSPPLASCSFSEGLLQLSSAPFTLQKKLLSPF